MQWIKFPSRELRDDCYDALNKAKTNSGEYLLNGAITTSSDDYIGFEREIIRDFGQFGEYMAMYKGKLE